MAISKYFFPLVIIAISCILKAAFKGNINAIPIELLNGSLSLIGISALFNMSSYLIRVKNNDKDPLKEDVLQLAQKLGNYKEILLIVGTVVYVLQIVFIEELVWWHIIIGLIVLLMLIVSLRIAANMFIIQEDLYVRAKVLIDEKKIESSIKKMSKGYAVLKSNLEEDEF